MTHVAPPQRHMYADLGIAVGYVRKRLQKSHTAALHFASRINLPTWLIPHEDDDGESWPFRFSRDCAECECLGCETSLKSYF
jgi:hypothetical protein